MSAETKSVTVPMPVVQSKSNSLKIPRVLSILLRYGVAVFVALFLMFPYYWMFTSSLKSVAETRQYPPTLLPERSVGLENYQAVFTRADFAGYFKNSVFVSVLTTAGALLTSALAGYIFAKFHFKGKNSIFAVIVATMMVPFPVILIPIFLIIRALGLYNSLWALIVPGIVTPWGIFLLRQYMIAIPSEIMDAARVDGASELAIFLRIVLPIARPGLAAVGIFIFMYHWNDYLWPMVVLEDAPLRTLPIGLARFSEGFGISRWNLVNAASVITVLPILIVFILAQRQFIEGITLGSTKG